MANNIVVEGPDDFHAIHALLKHYGLEKKVEVRDAGGGIDKLLKSMMVELRPGSSDDYAYVVDADAAGVEEDKQFEARWTSMRDRLLRCGYTNVPSTPNPAGVYSQQTDLPRVGVWMMPDNQVRGALEDFVELLITPGDLLWPFAQQCVRTLPEEPRFAEVHRLKAEIHTWLAWQKSPGYPIGRAITARYLDAQAPQAVIFVDWVRRVFQL